MAFTIQQRGDMDPNMSRSNFEMENFQENRSTAKLTEYEQQNTPPKEPFWKRWIDSFKPMEKGKFHHKDNNQLHGKTPESEDGLKRSLNNRHLQMIAFGGAIGTGLFIGSGGALQLAGPASLIIGFILIGMMLFNVVMALGELAVLYPVSGSFSVYAGRFIDPAWGFAMGWNYALGWLIVLPLELTAAAMTINYWGVTMRSSAWITIFLLVILIINCFGVKGYGEAEFVFSMVKIVAVIGFIILGIVIDVGGAPNGKFYGTQTWVNPGAFNNGFQGFCSVFVTAAFAFGGTEMVGLAAAESANPRKTLPKATKQVFWRISIFYVVTLFLVGLIVPYNHPRLLNSANNTGAARSPFVIAISEAGIKVLPSIFNGIILISVLSVGNSAVYGSSRTLCALAQNGQAPKFLGYIDREGRPLFAILLAFLIGLLAYVNESAESGQIFNWLLAISGLSGFFTWLSICWAHLRFRQAWKMQGHTFDELPYRAAFGVVGSWWGVIFNILILVAQFYIAVCPIGVDASAARFFKAYLAAPVILAFFIFWKLFKKTPFMVTHGGNSEGFFLFKTETIDLVTGRRDMNLKEVLAEERAAHAALPAWRRFYIAGCG